MLQLIKGCKKNKRGAQKLLYQKFYGYGMSVCMRYASDREEAVEVLNDAFLKVFTNLDKYDVKLPFKAWFRRILINESINNIKRKSGKFKESGLEGVPDVGQESTVLSELGHIELMEMIQQLSPQYQAVFNLHVIEGYSHEEISEMLSISPGTSKSNLSKAKDKLRQLLNKNLEVNNE